MATLTHSEIAHKLTGENLDVWLKLWRAEQGPAKRTSLELMASIIPYPSNKRLKVLDLCCGPGDVGRTIHSRFPRSQIDFVDRDLFLTSLCNAVNRHRRIRGKTLVRDLWEQNWHRGLRSDYDVVATANALHWFSKKRAARLFLEILDLLRPGGTFVFLEPVGPETAFARQFSRWKSTQPSQHNRENWLRFWTRVNALLGYNHTKTLGKKRDPKRISDRLSVMGWIELVKNAGYRSIDVLLRDPEKVVIAALKP
jgi:SAM-dependent methyltransferase